MFKFSIEVTISASDENVAGQQMTCVETSLRTHAPGVLAIKLAGGAERCTKQDILDIVREGKWNPTAELLVKRLDAAPDDKDAGQADIVVAAATAARDITQALNNAFSQQDRRDAEVLRAAAAIIERRGEFDLSSYHEGTTINALRDFAKWIDR